MNFDQAYEVLDEEEFKKTDQNSINLEFLHYQCYKLYQFYTKQHYMQVIPSSKKDIRMKDSW